MEKPPKKKWWRWGVNRWFILLFIIGSIVTAYTLGIKPIQPHVQLPAEKLSCTPLIALPAPFGDKPTEHCLELAAEGHGEAEPVTGLYLTNTMVAMLITDLILLIIGFGFYRYSKSGSLLPKGFSGAVEALLEVIYNLTQTTAGKFTKAIFPWFATITLFVLVANWTELIPLVDSFGILEKVHSGGYEIQSLTPWLSTIVKPEAGTVVHDGYTVVPFVRVVSTDLNFTVALALIAVVMVQVTGIRAQGMGYFRKFWNTKTLFSKPIFGVIDFAVGILEFVSEISKVLSFAFRLFGNIFAGSVLLFVIGSLVPVFAQTGFLMLEFFVGMIQAIVFGMLTMTFMAQATQSHGDHEESHA
ncbi:F0F1 ATP synthase subunit A [Chloroflexota bacterium]